MNEDPAVNLSRVMHHVPSVALLMAAILVVVLTLQNRSLQNRYAELQERSAWPHAGLAVPPFTARALFDSTEVPVGEPQEGHRQLLLFFTTTCQYCRTSLPAWRQLSQLLQDDSSVATVAISLDSAQSTREYAIQHGMSSHVITFPDSKYKSMYRARSVPQIVVLEADGRVSYVRRGVLADPVAIDSVIAAAATKYR
jgi:peroxiredoxin